MNKVIFKEIGYYLLCIVFIIVCGSVSGIFKSFNIDDISNEVVKKVSETGVEKYLTKDTDTSAQKQANTYGNYRPSYIPEKVLKGSETSGAWTHLFNSDKKVVFYVYEKDSKFHQEFSDYISKNSYLSYYQFEATPKNVFNSMMSGTVGPSKVCNSLEECNQYREKASNYTLLTSFLTDCGRGVCVFSPEKKQFVQLRRRSVKEAEKMVESLKNW